MDGFGVCKIPGIAKLGVGVDMWLSAGSQNSLCPPPEEMDGLIELISEEAEGCVWMHNTDHGSAGAGRGVCSAGALHSRLLLLCPGCQWGLESKTPWG